MKKALRLSLVAMMTLVALVPDVCAQGETTVQDVQDDFDHLITFSPLSLFTRWRYENINQGHFSWGSRAEVYGTAGGALAILPYGRAYTGTQGEGFYAEIAAGPVMYFSDEFSSRTLQGQFRLGLGSQWMGGRKVIRPRDFSVSINLDTFYLSEVVGSTGSDDFEAIVGLFGPWSILKVRFQRGIGW